MSLTPDTELVILDGGSLTADRYMRDVLEHVMHNNAHPHCARIVTEYLLEVKIPVLGWPTNSLDLNTI